LPCGGTRTRTTIRTDPFPRTDAYPPAVRVLRLNDKQRALDHYARIADRYHQARRAGPGAGRVPPAGAWRSSRSGAARSRAVPRRRRLRQRILRAGGEAARGSRLRHRRRGLRCSPRWPGASTTCGCATSSSSGASAPSIGSCARRARFVVDPNLALANILRPGGAQRAAGPPRPVQGPGGSLYRAEKRLFRVRGHLFTHAWLAERAASHGLRVVRVRRPLPWNIAIAAVRP